MYKLRISSQAKSQLRKISKTHKRALLEAMLEIKSNPFIGKPLKRELKGRFSFRVGIYRVIYKVRKKDRVVEIIVAGHRAGVYN